MSLVIVHDDQRKRTVNFDLLSGEVDIPELVKKYKNTLHFPDKVSLQVYDSCCGYSSPKSLHTSDYSFAPLFTVDANDDFCGKNIYSAREQPAGCQHFLDNRRPRAYHSQPQRVGQAHPPPCLP
jgi:hypothetical protein